MENKKKKNYKSPKIEIIEINKDEIIVTSGATNSFGASYLGGKGYNL